MMFACVKVSTNSRCKPSISILVCFTNMRLRLCDIILENARFRSFMFRTPKKMKKSKATAVITNLKKVTLKKQKKIAVGDLLSVTQDILKEVKVDYSENKSNTLFLYGAKMEQKSPDSSDSEDYDDLSLNSSSRSQYWNGRYGKAFSDTVSLHSSESSSSLNSRYLTPKEMVKDISLRVERHQVPPDYGFVFILFQLLNPNLTCSLQSYESMSYHRNYCLGITSYQKEFKINGQDYHFQLISSDVISQSR